MKLTRPGKRSATAEPGGKNCAPLSCGKKKKKTPDDEQSAIGPQGQPSRENTTRRRKSGGE